MRKGALFVLLLLLLLLSGLLFWKSHSIEKRDTHFEQFPSFVLEQDTGQIAIPNDLPRGDWTGIILVKFDSDCSICQMKGASMARDMELLKSFLVIMTSSEEITGINNFASQYQLDIEPNFVFGKMSEEDFYQNFREVGVPHTFLFDKNGSLLHQFSGNPSLQALLSAFYDI